MLESLYYLAAGVCSLPCISLLPLVVRYTLLFVAELDAEMHRLSLPAPTLPDSSSPRIFRIFRLSRNNLTAPRGLGCLQCASCRMFCWLDGPSFTRDSRLTFSTQSHRLTNWQTTHKHAIYTAPLNIIVSPLDRECSNVTPAVIPYNRQNKPIYKTDPKTSHQTNISFEKENSTFA
jgi:hypothetical protein